MVLHPSETVFLKHNLIGIGLTFEEEIYDRPCIVDDSKNSRKISIFTYGVAFSGGKRFNDICLVFSTLDGSSYSNILQVQLPCVH